MGKKTDAFSTAVTAYGTNAAKHKTIIANGITAQVTLFKTFQTAEIARNAGKGTDSALNTAFSDWQDEKQKIAKAKSDLLALVRALEKATTDFKAYIKVKKLKIKLNPFKGKASLPTAEAAITYAEQLTAADKDLCR